MSSFLIQGSGLPGKPPPNDKQANKRANKDNDLGVSNELDSEVLLTDEQRRAAQQEAIMIVSNASVLFPGSLSSSDPSTARPWLRRSRQNYNGRFQTGSQYLSETAAEGSSCRKNWFGSEQSLFEK